MMRRWFIWLSFLLLFEPASVEAATYYVKKTGSNSNNCATATNPSTPKLTIGSTNGSGGAGCLENPGDVLIVGDGTYTEAEIQINQAHMTTSTGGTALNPITIRAENTHGAIISSTSRCNPNISLYANYVTVDGFDLRIDASNVYCTPNSAAGTAIRCWSGYTGCKIRYNKTDDPVGGSGTIRSHGFKSNQPNTVIEYNLPSAGIETLAANNTIIRYNLIACDATSGHGGGNWGHAMVNKGGSTGVQIYGNVINASCITGWGILLGGSTDQSVVHTYECISCVSHHNIVTVSTSGEALGFQGCNGCAHYNNTTFNGDFSMNVGPSAGNNNNSWKNNHVDCGGSNATSNLSGTYTIDYNNFRNCTGAPSQSHAISGDPLFVNAGASDYGLQAGSPNINTGVDVGLQYNGSAPDVGAFETIQHALCSVENADASTLRITFTNNYAPPLLPSTSLSGFTARKAGSNNVVTATTRTGDNSIYLTLTDAIINGDAVDYSYSTGTGNITDSSLIAGTYNQRLNAVTTQSCTNNVTGSSPAYQYTQTAFYWHGLRGTESAPMVLTYNGTDGISLPAGAKVRLRVEVTCTVANCPAIGFIPRYSLNGGSYTVIPDDFAADNIAFLGTSAEPDVPLSGTATTAGSVACAIIRTSNAIPTISLNTSQTARCEYAVRFDTDASGVYTFRLYDQNGAVLNGGYSVTPKVTMVGAQASGGR